MPSSILATALEHKWSVLATSLVAYVVSVCIYRSFLHPLAKVPGPFLPAVTKLYQSYHNYRYYQEIERLHQKYGPIVRITPDEVHLADADDYDKIYYIGSKYWKDPNLYNALCVPYSSFGSPTNEVHKIRRGALNPMFSRQMVLQLESIVQEKADKVCQRMQEGVDQKKPVDLHHAFRAVSVDVISEFAFTNCYNFLEQDDIGEEFFQMARGFGPAWYGFRQFPSLVGPALKIPPWLAPYLNPSLGYVNKIQAECIRQVEGVRAKLRDGKELGRRTIFMTLLSNENQPEGYQVPSTEQVKDEVYSVLVAAADTTGNAMSVAAFNVLYNREIYQKLAAELKARFPHQTENLPFVELEKLPYLTAVIKEGLRLSFGVIGRLPRIVPEPGVTFHDQFLPPGTTVSMSSWMMHRDPAVFSDPMKFDPQRWLKSNEEFRLLDRNMVPFGRGTRQCVGMPLAYAELYVTLGTLFRRFPEGLRVWKTTPETMQDYQDYFSSYHPLSRREEWLKAYTD